MCQRLDRLLDAFFLWPLLGTSLVIIWLSFQYYSKQLGFQEMACLTVMCILSPKVGSQDFGTLFFFFVPPPSGHYGFPIEVLIHRMVRAWSCIGCISMKVNSSSRSRESARICLVKALRRLRSMVTTLILQTPYSNISIYLPFSFSPHLTLVAWIAHCIFISGI